MSYCYVGCGILSFLLRLLFIFIQWYTFKRWFYRCGGWFSFTHLCYLCGSQPLYFNLQAGPLQDSVHFPSLNYLQLKVLTYVLWLVYMHIGKQLYYLFCGERHFDVMTRNYTCCFLLMVTAMYFPFRGVWWLSVKFLMGSTKTFVLGKKFSQLF